MLWNEGYASSAWLFVNLITGTDFPDLTYRKWNFSLRRLNTVSSALSQNACHKNHCRKQNHETKPTGLSGRKRARNTTLKNLSVTGKNKTRNLIKTGARLDTLDGEEIYKYHHKYGTWPWNWLEVYLRKRASEGLPLGCSCEMVWGEACEIRQKSKAVTPDAGQVMAHNTHGKLRQLPCALCEFLCGWVQPAFCVHLVCLADETMHKQTQNSHSAQIVPQWINGTGPDLRFQNKRYSGADLYRNTCTPFMMGLFVRWCSSCHTESCWILIHFCVCLQSLTQCLACGRRSAEAWWANEAVLCSLYSLLGLP